MSEHDALSVLADMLGEPIEMAAYRFLGGGGSWSLSDGMTRASVAALVAAGKQLRVEQALRIGRCAESGRGRIETLAELDGGDALATAGVAEMIDQVNGAITNGV